MIIGIGTDIVPTHTFQGKGAHVLSKWFSDEEMAYCESKQYPHRHYAARWAAKEACLKALNLSMSVGMKNIVISHSRPRSGKPVILFRGHVKAHLSNPHAKIHVSMSHNGDYATAVVVAEE